MNPADPEQPRPVHVLPAGRLEELAGHVDAIAAIAEEAMESAALAQAVVEEAPDQDVLREVVFNQMVRACGELAEDWDEAGTGVPKSLARELLSQRCSFAPASEWDSRLNPPLRLSQPGRIGHTYYAEGRHER